MPFSLENAGGLPCYRSPLLSAFPEMVHGFFTRQGGVSPAPYNSLNLSFTVGDQRPQVIHNRSLVQQALRLTALVSATQVHGCRESLITAANAAPYEEIPDADILLTGQPGLSYRHVQTFGQSEVGYQTDGYPAGEFSILRGSETVNNLLVCRDYTGDYYWFIAE